MGIKRFVGLAKKYREIMAYCFFGVATTLINIIIYAVLSHTLTLGTMPSTIIAWVLSVLFAYLTNRKWVFHSTVTQIDNIAREIVSFFSCRFATGVVDWVCMFFFVDCFHLNDMIIKAGVNILVIVLNFIASKWLIFHGD